MDLALELGIAVLEVADSDGLGISATDAKGFRIVGVVGINTGVDLRFIFGVGFVVVIIDISSYLSQLILSFLSFLLSFLLILS